MGRKLAFVILSDDELKELKELMRDLALKKKFRMRLRCNALFMSNQCKTVRQISHELNRSTRTVYQWLKRYRQKGIAGIMPRDYSRKLNREQLHELLKESLWYLVGAHTKEFHKRWTFREMSEWVYKRWDITLSPNRMRQIVREALENADMPKVDKNRHG
ncbi:MAG: helix-turn-helix domain-containing protein [Planctomycetes bacterium]|nr:helix-turn-helix domain-containing protein [Planctomycetota bacterium]